jgi:hypothetical protein
MSELVTVCRATVIADGALEKRLLKQFWQLGIKGFSRMECQGQGEHEVVGDVFGGLSRVRIEMIVQPPVGEAIVKYLHRPEFDNQAVTVCLENVQVSPADKF